MRVLFFALKNPRLLHKLVTIRNHSNYCRQRSVKPTALLPSLPPDQYKWFVPIRHGLKKQGVHFRLFTTNYGKTILSIADDLIFQMLSYYYLFQYFLSLSLKSPVRHFCYGALAGFGGIGGLLFCMSFFGGLFSGCGSP